jgi:hypothetical protein
MLHVSTADDETRKTIITPEGIWRGHGDGYLKLLNNGFAEYGKPAFLRPLGESNRLWNNYSAFNSYRQSRGPRNTTSDYRQAFRRIYIIVKGGSRKNINQQLRKLGMPSIQVPTKRVMPRPSVQVVWSPLPNNQGIRRNAPRYFWPGKKYVDVVGTSFFSAWPFWSDLNAFYWNFNYRKPFMIAEWGLNSDDPRFAADLIRWCKARSRCKSMFYYRGFNDSYELRNFPRSADAIRAELKKPRLPEFYPEWLSGSLARR